MSNTQQITFIGAGNMARSLITGLIGSGYPATKIVVSDPMPAQLQALEPLGVSVTSSNPAAIEGSAAVVLAVKPQVLGKVVSGLGSLQATQLLISIAAGVPISSLVAWSDSSQPVIRCMPNTPAILGAGITALYAGAGVTQAQRALAENVLAAAGKTLWVESESDLDAVTAVSGSGPAYFFYLMEAMIEAGQSLGLDGNTALTLTLETAYGAALMAREGTQPPAALRENVTSPGGTTAAALSVLDAADTKQIIRQALARAASRSQELAREFGQS